MLLAQERAKELAAHEEQLEEWKKRFKAEALRQISEREKALTEWQGQLESSRAELEHLKENMEVGDSRRVGEVCCRSWQTADLPVNTDLQLLHHDVEALKTLKGRLHSFHNNRTLQIRYKVFIFSQTSFISASLY